MYSHHHRPQDHNSTAQERPSTGTCRVPCPSASRSFWFPSDSPPPSPPPSSRPCHIPHNPFAVHNYRVGPVPLTEEQVRQVFMKFDLNGDNVLSGEEIRQAFKHLGAVYPAQMARKGIEHADINGDGVIDMSEMEDFVRYAYNLGFVVR
ncbi:hypothetical protein MANES_04G102000v8 [Manihot esculenta]|uniref:EF-hand domain-containing protein n=1 Tax=Manihot esculenta TaxID=3983 RepID=A0A2C9W3F8_MANES|nr:hypothetical protein MANES_04G102000v8 [Manihot esculenta]